MGKYSIAQRLVFLALLTLIGMKARASVFHCNGKEVSKGTAIVTLAQNPKASCTKTDAIEFNTEKGTIKVKKVEK